MGRVIIDEIDSTNAAALRGSYDTQSSPYWLLAHRQVSGRGRRGKPWQDPRGNFAATLCLPNPGLSAEAASLRSFVAALALYDALIALTGRSAPFSLKWPNDVLLNGGKLAGILLESTGHGGQITRLAVGIGVNLTDAPIAAELPEGALPPVSLLSETGVALTPEEFLDRLAPAFAHWEARLRQGGFAPIRNAWLARAARLGERITVTRPGQSLNGVFETLDETGALVLNDGAKRHAIPAGEIQFET
ncbi:MAG: biotin--[acetyl-CoA-carboxylase] ligase [Mangrovicoccus sp.]|nr:biotin--[acetyl-CoA-carboxylase] ligase [Mangrovicoccus sp.]